ncbi:MAG: hypothetical protein A2W91_08410 [Bacteroidetes bacterium GWF2_38_335]|nr:MAG: hypothetical protein A2W91_08410 [Bacteroidetes bacterium GWF2_38_335]OFY78936.1 MAG: hypothetical protein A2281_02310 [Bacteroidetes bacterium RIFOXYA12_FULL_38_20]HBS86000.1 gas vesicle protein [Bacteroidales bacterium]
MSTGKVVLGVVAGLAVGALLGILFAPEKGSVTRKKITAKSDEFTDSLKEKFNEFLDNLVQNSDHLKEDGHEHTKKSDPKTEKA